LNIREEPDIAFSLKELPTNLRGNIFGGVTAAVVALPLALAFGIASGMGPAAGLTGAVVLGFIASILGGTRTQISGPTGPMTVVVTSLAISMASQYPVDATGLIVATIMLAGILQVLFGIFHLGKYFIMVPYPVISGFMSGIGVIIIALQIGPLLGFQTAGGVVPAIEALPSQALNFHADSLVVGMAALFLLLFWPARWNRIVPAPVVVLILGVLFVMLLPEARLETIGELPLMMPGIHIPVFHLDMLQQIFIGAVMLAALGSIDSLLTSLVSENITGVPHDSDRELIGQGVGNTVAGLFGGLPGAGATMRTMVNIQAGADGRLSGVVHAVILGLIAVGLGSFFEHIPLAVLAGILIKVGIDIIDWPFLRRVRQLPLLAVGLMMLVLLLTVFVNLIAAVLIGMFIKNLVTLEKLSTIQLGQLKMSNGLEEVPGVSEEQAEFLRDNSVLLVKLDGPLSYSVARGLGQRFQQLPAADRLVIELGQASFIGVTSALAIEDLIRVAQKDEMNVSVVDYRRSQHKELADVGITQLIPAERFYQTFSDFKTAVEASKV